MGAPLTMAAKCRPAQVWGHIASTLRFCKNYHFEEARLLFAVVVREPRCHRHDHAVELADGTRIAAR